MAWQQILEVLHGSIPTVIQFTHLEPLLFLVMNIWSHPVGLPKLLPDSKNYHIVNLNLCQNCKNDKGKSHHSWILQQKFRGLWGFIINNKVSHHWHLYTTIFLDLKLLAVYIIPPLLPTSSAILSNLKELNYYFGYFFLPVHILCCFSHHVFFGFVCVCVCVCF